MKNIIITCGSEKDIDSYLIYKRVIEDLGFEGKLMPPGIIERRKITMLKKSSGLVLCGGGDIASHLYTSSPVHPRVGGVDIRRDIMEKNLFHLALEWKKPVLGICRGLQVMNWSLGGDLYQDLDGEFSPEGSEKRHQQKDYGMARWLKSHKVLIEKGSLAHAIFGRTVVEVNSTHHQGLKKIAGSMRVTGRAPDGVVEIVEMPSLKNFVLGVQFHPEKLYRTDNNMRKLFKYFARVINTGGLICQ
ncbi:MAG: gamma-glutamyl-gamma-aminobutyrate hydrolase family protein [Vulcanimicrobiota bacterium]